MAYTHTVPVSTAGRSEGSVQTSDEALVQLIASGDKKALQILFTRHNVQILWGERRGDYIHRRGCNPSDGAPDATAAQAE